MSFTEQMMQNTTGPFSIGGRTIITTGKTFPRSQMRVFIESKTLKNIQIIDIDSKIKYSMALTPELKSLLPQDVTVLVRTIFEDGNPGHTRYNIAMRNNIRQDYLRF